MNIEIFYILAAIILIFSALSVTSGKILRVATYLLFVLIATAGLYFLLGVNFLGAVQLMLYAGGIVVLIIFAILLTSRIESKFDTIETPKRILTGVLTAAGCAITLTAVLKYDWASKVVANSAQPEVKDFGRAFLSYGDHGFILPFEVITILLLAAMVAAIMIAKKSTVDSDKQIN